jgi:hypothetical protein
MNRKNNAMALCLRWFKQGLAIKMQRSARTMRNRRFFVRIVGVYLFSVGLLTGMIFDRIRFDESRTVLLKELEENTRRLHQRLMAMEREAFVQRK